GTYLCTYDCSLDNVTGTCVSLRSMMEQLKQKVQANRIVLVLQAGYSGAAQLNEGAKEIFSPKNMDIEKLLLGKGYAIISSSKPDQLSWTDVFSSSFIKALMEDDGLIRLPDAFAKARDETEA